MSKQSCSTVMMIRPAHFGFNEETAANNYFQDVEARRVLQQASEKARAEFDAFVDQVSEKGIEVLVFEDTIDPRKPDAVFPNNWISLHDTGQLITYPMCAVSRRPERRMDIIQYFIDTYAVESYVQLEGAEDSGAYLEGTGSMILDRDHKIAYACRSARTDEALFRSFCSQMGYWPVVFDAVDASKQPIYHTNVIMSVGIEWVVLCLEAIPEGTEKQQLLQSIANSGKTLVEISLDQVNQFAGNILQVLNKKEELFLIMSDTAFNSLKSEQREILFGDAEPIVVKIPTVERLGGGSARCMLAEVFLSPNS